MTSTDLSMHTAVFYPCSHSNAELIPVSGHMSTRDPFAQLSGYFTPLTRVEAGSNTSTVTLRVVRGDEMGLKKAAP
jgi:hypothetical protein